MRVKWFVPSGEQSFKPFGLDCERAALHPRCGGPTLNRWREGAAVPADLGWRGQTCRASPSRPAPDSGLCQGPGPGRTRP